MMMMKMRSRRRRRNDPVVDQEKHLLPQKQTIQKKIRDYKANIFAMKVGTTVVIGWLASSLRSHSAAAAHLRAMMSVDEDNGGLVKRALGERGDPDEEDQQLSDGVFYEEDEDQP